MTVETAGFFGGPGLLVDGVPLKRRKGRYLFPNEAGQSVPVDLKHNLFDPVPTVKIGAETVEHSLAH